MLSTPYMAHSTVFLPAIWIPAISQVPYPGGRIIPLGRGMHYTRLS